MYSPTIIKQPSTRISTPVQVEDNTLGRNLLRAPTVAHDTGSCDREHDEQGVLAEIDRGGDSEVEVWSGICLHCTCF